MTVIKELIIEPFSTKEKKNYKLKNKGLEQRLGKLEKAIQLLSNK
jgi:hypothetical protein